ncbi:MAG: hypothetical protein VXW87_01180 [Pseudomonadota bacterium]|nr:hypothetical protein [Pseudomonadota bacterium]
MHNSKATTEADNTAVAKPNQTNPSDIPASAFVAINDGPASMEMSPEVASSRGPSRQSQTSQHSTDSGFGGAAKPSGSLPATLNSTKLAAHSFFSELPAAEQEAMRQDAADQASHVLDSLEQQVNADIQSTDMQLLFADGIKNHLDVTSIKKLLIASFPVRKIPRVFGRTTTEIDGNPDPSEYYEKLTSTVVSIVANALNPQPSKKDADGNERPQWGLLQFTQATARNQFQQKVKPAVASVLERTILDNTMNTSLIQHSKGPSNGRLLNHIADIRKRAPKLEICVENKRARLNDTNPDTTDLNYKKRVIPHNETFYAIPESKLNKLTELLSKPDDASSVTNSSFGKSRV